MVDISNYVGRNGFIDWKAFREAEVNAGEICLRCHSFTYPPKGSPGLCVDCARLDDCDDEVTHPSLIRCPSCKELLTPTFEHNIWDEGDHCFDCEICGTEFTIHTKISFEFTSPPKRE